LPLLRLLFLSGNRLSMQCLREPKPVNRNIDDTERRPLLLGYVIQRAGLSRHLALAPISQRCEPCSSAAFGSTYSSPESAARPVVVTVCRSSIKWPTRAWPIERAAAMRRKSPPRETPPLLRSVNSGHRAVELVQRNNTRSRAAVSWFRLGEPQRSRSRPES
jgi:hypothetical protein